ncbi:MAG TPA: hypothetical protein PKI17_05025 [Syntrophomonas sp.]|jgi:hypothetical protein|nr:hypothetical protein [Syntrophomonas sp.]
MFKRLEEGPVMVDGNYTWKCTNMSCGSTQEIPRQAILDRIKQGKKVVLVCGNCGYISLGDGAVTPGEMDNAYKCVPWSGSEQRQPAGFTPAGWVSANGEAPISAKLFMARWGVHPEINWRWRKKSVKA